MTKPKSEPPRGVLNKQERDGLFGLSRYHPGEKLDFFVEHYWIVKWDLRGRKPYEQDVLAHPSIHLVFEKENTRIWGIVTGKFTRKIEGKGKVLGVKFRPGGFYPFYQKPVAGFVDNLLSFSDLFDEDLKNLESQILNHNENEKMVEQAERFLKSHLPPEDPKVEKVRGIVEAIKDEKAILKVDDIVRRFKMSKRSLQRLFRQYVGVSPKWVIQRYRLHEAAEKLASEKSGNWTQLALELGYFDQSHFIRDFKAMIGQTPGDYLESFHSKQM